MTMVWVVSRSRLKTLLVPHLLIYHPSHHRDNVTAPHGRPISEVGYTSATARRGDHESSYGNVVTLEKKNNIMDHRRLCGPSLTETSLCGAYLYLPPRDVANDVTQMLSNLRTLYESEPSSVVFINTPIRHH